MKIVVDASVVVPILTRHPLSAPADARWRQWVEQGSRLYAPALMIYEVVSAVRKHQAAGGYGRPEDAERALDRLWALGLRMVGPTPALGLSALRWAGRTGDRVAYDGQYLALAERLQAALWTADEGLFLGALRAGFGRVRRLTPMTPVRWADNDLRQEVRRLTLGHEGDLPGLLRGGIWEGEVWNRPEADETAPTVCIVSDDKGRPVGLVSWSGPKNAVTPAWWIAPPFRGQGFGSKAVRALAHELWNRGFTGIGPIVIQPVDCPTCRPQADEIRQKSERLAGRLRQAFDEVRAFGWEDTP